MSIQTRPHHSGSKIYVKTIQTSPSPQQNTDKKPLKLHRFPSKTYIKTAQISPFWRQNTYKNRSERAILAAKYT
jgi:hypothetical protein